MTTMSSTPRAAMSPSQRTPRLKLHTFTADDTGELHALFADPETNTVGAGPFAARRATERWIAHRVAAERDHGLCWYALRCSRTGLLIGNCGMFKGRTGAEEPEIGYMIRAAQRGRGYRDFADAGVRESLEKFMGARAWIHAEGAVALFEQTRAWIHAEGAVALFEQTRAWLRRERVLLPGVSVLARLMVSMRKEAAQRAYRSLAQAAAG